MLMKARDKENVSIVQRLLEVVANLCRGKGRIH